MLAALIVDPDNNMRNRLRQALHGSSVYRSVRMATTFGEARLHLEKAEGAVDVVLVSAAFGEPLAQAFFDSARKIKASSDAAFILILRGDESYASALANNLIAGADGFLIAPFSVSGVTDTAEIANLVKKRNADQRLVAATGVVVDSMMNEIDKRAKRKSEGKVLSKISKELREAGNQFKIVAGESMKSFYDTLAESSAARAAPERRDDDASGYQGPSERIRRRAAAKAAEAELAENTDPEEQS